MYFACKTAFPFPTKTSLLILVVSRPPCLRASHPQNSIFQPLSLVFFFSSLPCPLPTSPSKRDGRTNRRSPLAYTTERCLSHLCKNRGASIRCWLFLPFVPFRASTMPTRKHFSYHISFCYLKPFSMLLISFSLFDLCTCTDVFL